MPDGGKNAWVMINPGHHQAAKPSQDHASSTVHPKRISLSPSTFHSVVVDQVKQDLEMLGLAFLWCEKYASCPSGGG